MKSSRFITAFFPFAFDNQNFEEIDKNQLHENIKRRYMFYNAQDIDKFPVFEYNTNRKNYEPLKESFEEEFFNQRGINRKKNNLHIPSTNTLALLFTDESYIPSQKILNTCRSYSERTTKSDYSLDEKSNSFTFFPVSSIKIRVLMSILLLLGFILLISFSYKLFLQKNEQLQISSPNSNTDVPRILTIEGSAKKGREIWIVVKPKFGNLFYVQAPIQVQKKGNWNGMVIVGSVGDEDIGQVYEIKAFINPSKKINTGDVLNSWPTSEVSTETVEVTRSSNLTQ
jgi:hypothetical protein